MKIHPRIKKFIDILEDSKFNEFSKDKKDILYLLKNNGATQTEAVITIHLLFGFSLGEVEAVVYPSQVWEPEHLQDIAYQTLLYMSDYER